MSNLSFPQEPAIWVGLIAAVLGLVAVFFPGLLSDDKQKAILGLAVVAIPIVLSFVTRSQVTPNAKVAPVGQNIVVPLPPPAVPPTP